MISGGTIFLPLLNLSTMAPQAPKISEPSIAGVVSTTQLKALFAQLLLDPSGVCVRTRLLGEMWHPNFMHVLMITKTGVIILNDEVLRKAVTILRTEDIVQFEIDRKFQIYEPHFHYDVRVDSQP